MSTTSERPDKFFMQIHSGMLETMGHNMYSSVAKCLAEFVANAYDADAKNVSIEMDFDAIAEAKKQVRETARKEKQEGKRTEISAIYDPLPENIVIKITDDGHGMSTEQIQECFMAITRNRRKDSKGMSTNIFTESGKRRVMGRKGVGKLAGFGAAEHVKITSKRTGKTYATSFEMDYQSIKNNTDLTKTPFNANYLEDQNIEEHYTVVELNLLRCDSLKPTRKTIVNSLSRTFAILDKDFSISLNKETVEDEKIDWEFVYPQSSSINNLASTTVIVDKDDPESKFDIQYLIRFRARPNDHDADPEKKKKRGSLPAERRGARIYCHGRISHGPSLLKLHSGVHNFHAQDYMECIVFADAIDEFEHDCIVTSREGLHKDNPVVNALFDTVTALMKEALKQHYKYRDKEIETAIEDDEYSKGILSPIQSLNKKSQNAAKKILKVIGKEHGLKSETYREMAPIMLQAVNASEVLTKLIALETNPKSIPELAHSLVELTRMEKSDMLKLYRGRSNAINALRKLHEDSISTKKGKGYENELHSLFKDSPWLISPEYASYITSDNPMGQVCKTLNEVLKIDDGIGENTINDLTRPDLVFLAANQPNPDNIVIVELKSPGIELEHDHLNQLEEYMMKVEEHLSSKLNKNVHVSGYLIGTKPTSTATSTGKNLLLKKIASVGPHTPYKIIDILELIETAAQIHGSGIEALELEEKKLNEELS